MQGGRRAGDYPLARVDVNVEPLYSASVTRRGDSLPRRKSSEVRERRTGGGDGGGERERVGGGGGGESRCGRWNKRGQRLVGDVVGRGWVYRGRSESEEDATYERTMLKVVR